VSDAARFFLALSDPTRLELIDQLRQESRTVGELVDALGCPQPKVSRHLKVLRDAQIVRDLREGRHVRYELATRSGWPREAREWVDRLDHGLGGLSRPAPAAPASPRPTADLEDYLL
jgi:DNA-binding transcriptional ArsR family regulator